MSTERKTVVKCVSCGVELRLPVERAGWVVCPACKSSVWFSTRSSKKLFDWFRFLIANYAHVLLLLSLLSGSLATVVFYSVFPSASPLLWSLFCFSGLTVTLVVRRRSRRIREAFKSLATKLTVIFSAWSAAALLFITANASLGLNYLDVDQVSIRLLLALQPLARVVHYLPAMWIPALVAAAFVAVLALPALRARQADHGNSRSTRLVPRVLGPFMRVIAWLHSSRAGSRVVGLLPAVGNAVGAVKAIAVGLLAFGLGAGVQTVGFVHVHAAALEALSAAAVRAEVEWNTVTGHILVATVIRELEETAREEERCGPSDGRADGACADQSTTLPGSLLRTIYQRRTPYTPPPSPPRSGDPACQPDSPSGGGGPGPRPGTPTSAPDSDRSQQPTETAVVRSRLADHILHNLGVAWDGAAAALRRGQGQAGLASAPRDASVASLREARGDLARQHPSPAAAWLADLTAASLAAAESGSAEAVKAALRQAVRSSSSLGWIVSEFFDLFLSGPAIEAARERAAEFLRTRHYQPITIVAEQVKRRAVDEFRKVRNVLRFGASTADTAETAAVHATLRDEIFILFDRAFQFQAGIGPGELSRLREDLIAAVIPPTAPVSDVLVDKVESVMTYLSATVPQKPEQRFERLLRLTKFGVDTSAIAQLRDQAIAAAVDEVLRSVSPSGAISRGALRDGWSQSVAPLATGAWLEGRTLSAERVLGQPGLGLAPYLPARVRCGQCVDFWSRRPYGPYMCLAPGESPPCLDLETAFPGSMFR